MYYHLVPGIVYSLTLVAKCLSDRRPTLKACVGLYMKNRKYNTFIVLIIMVLDIYTFTN